MSTQKEKVHRQHNNPQYINAWCECMYCEDCTRMIYWCDHHDDQREEVGECV